MKRVDDRTDEQRKTHTTLITATDKCMSGWGEAKNGLSKCAWACEPENCDKVLNWVEGRTDMKHVGVCYGDWKPRNAEHLHIYAVGDTHTSLN